MRLGARARGSDVGTVYGPQGGKVGVGERGGGGIWELVLMAVTWALCTTLKVARWVWVSVGVGVGVGV